MQTNIIAQPDRQAIINTAPLVGLGEKLSPPLPSPPLPSLLFPSLPPSLPSPSPSLLYLCAYVHACVYVPERSSLHELVCMCA